MPLLMKRSHYLLVTIGALLVVSAACWFKAASDTKTETLQTSQDGKSAIEKPQDASGLAATAPPGISLNKGNPADHGVKTIATASHSGASGTPAVPLPATAASPAKEVFRAADYRPVTYPQGVPNYDGERVTAYVSLPSGGATATGAPAEAPQKLALTVNQMGEYPRVNIQAGEAVHIHLAFTDTKEGTPVAMSAQDGGTVEGKKLSAAGMVDVQRQLAFAFQSGQNPGIYRVNLRTPNGEVKTLNFWVGPPSVLQATR